MIRPDQVPDVSGATAYDADGTRLGQVTALDLDTDGSPLAATVRSGGEERSVPLAGAVLEGTTLRLGAEEPPVVMRTTVAEVVRSEERLVGGVEAFAAERARVVVELVTEVRTVEVEVRKQVARLVVEPVVDGPVVPGRARPSEVAYTLYEEVPEVVLRPRPYATARLVIETDVRDEVRTGEVRKEVVGYEEVPAELA
ncbi:uncharacterized protein DUF2382 [Motilibacter rhizosphaerae]|uniref:Uncharacterized protein DUF2382 n=1 Tax=Motilibacter rhizosphaerae TaxID=598652 RepID=A0A4Q7NPH1_9ACTN|nr:PRC-barrel domain-containing protein [Motilibacter rhizosphaerae]RZS86856.1 uncharacterized protein DUF2382 [Motilibacter rhizosphaerae]